MTLYTIHALAVGFNETDQGIMTYLHAYESMKRIRDAADIIIPLHDLHVGKKKTIPE